MLRKCVAERVCVHVLVLRYTSMPQPARCGMAWIFAVGVMSSALDQNVFAKPWLILTVNTQAWYACSMDRLHLMQRVCPESTVEAPSTTSLLMS